MSGELGLKVWNGCLCVGWVGWWRFRIIVYYIVHNNNMACIVREKGDIKVADTAFD